MKKNQRRNSKKTVAADKTWWNQLLMRLLAVGILALGSTGAVSQSTALGSVNRGIGGPTATTQSDTSKLIWFKYDHRTEDGQVILPWKEFVKSWPVTCNEWNQNQERRVVIFTALAPDTLMIQSPKKDSKQEGTWSVDKIYPIDSRYLHLHGEWRKTLVTHINIGKDRPSTLIMHEEECFRKLTGLPGLLLESEASGAEPVRYSMTIDEGKFEKQPTMTLDASGRVVKSYEYIGTVKMSETYWSYMKREWFRLLGLAAVILTIASGFYVLVRKICRRKMCSAKPEN